MALQQDSKSFFQVVCLDEDKMAECVSYVFVCPVLIIFGIIGSVANILLVNGSDFKTVTFFYLRALSLCDMFYIITFGGYVVEILFIKPFDVSKDSYIPTFYLTHIDHILCTTFVGASGFLIVLLTIDRYQSICLPMRWVWVIWPPYTPSGPGRGTLDCWWASPSWWPSSSRCRAS